MAIALRDPAGRQQGSLVRPVLVLIAALILLGGIALSGGLQLPQTPASGSSVESARGDGPLFDGRGKWTGYTR